MICFQSRLLKFTLVAGLIALASKAVLAQVNIPDPALQAEIEGILGKSSGDPISEAEMATITNITAQNAGIQDLTGLETATSLSILRLSVNAIADLSPIQNLTTLTLLQVDRNNISSVSALTNLVNLTRLEAWDNSITDISALSTLTALEYIDLATNQISDISALSGMSVLQWLYLFDNEITDISVLSGLTSLIDVEIENNFLNINPGSDDRTVIDNLIANEVTVTYEPQKSLPGSTYADWIALYGPLPNGDGTEDRNGPLLFPNIIAFSMGLDPSTTIPDQVPSATYDAVNEVYSFFYYRDTNATGITRTIESSTVLSGWSAVTPDSEVIVSTDGSVEYVEARFNDATNLRRFFQLRVE